MKIKSGKGFYRESCMPFFQNELWQECNKSIASFFIESESIVRDWQINYEDEGILDGVGWHLILRNSQITLRSGGESTFPKNWNALIDLMAMTTGASLKQFRRSGSSC